MPKTVLQTITGLIILACWVAALSSGILTHDYQGLTIVTPVMLVYAGYIFGESFFQRRKNDVS